MTVAAVVLLGWLALGVLNGYLIGRFRLDIHVADGVAFAPFILLVIAVEVAGP